MAVLCVNVDHVATVREARRISEPDPVAAAIIVELAGASGVTIHLREDRRHIQERDLKLVREVVKTKLNLEMAAVPSMVKIALLYKPNCVCLVPEKREEITTEGGLDVAGNQQRIKRVVSELQSTGIVVSLFIEPVEKQVRAAKNTGATFIEIHTGAYANARDEQTLAQELSTIRDMTEFAKSLGLRVNAGHGLNYRNVQPIAAIPILEDLNIGHSIISHAIFVGLERAVKEMIDLINRGAQQHQ